MSNRRKPLNDRVNGRPYGRGTGLGKLVVPEFLGVTLDAWTDAPPAQYPPHVADYIGHELATRTSDAYPLNGYVCEDCKGLTITRDRHPGVTPMFVSHEQFDPATRCPGRTASLGYPTAELPAGWEPSHEWYRPSEPALLGIDSNGIASRDAIIDHVLRGGLLIRPIPAADAPRAR